MKNGMMRDGRGHGPGWGWLGVIAAALIAAVMVVGCPPVTPEPDPEPDPRIGPAAAPGLFMEIKDVEVPNDRRPEVTFTIKDRGGNHVPVKELTRLRFALSYLDEAPRGGGATRLISYHPDEREQNGVEYLAASSDRARLDGVTQDADGVMRYKFDTVLPADFDGAATHQLHTEAIRDNPVDGKTYNGDAWYRFRPAGLAVTETREVVSTEACNQCHSRVEGHTRIDVHRQTRTQDENWVQGCMVCHNTPDTSGPFGEPLDFAALIHKIHRGMDLPSAEQEEPFRTSRNEFAYSKFPQDIRNCQVCHTEDAPDHRAYLENPTMAGCASCHDRAWFGHPDDVPEGYEMHVGGQQVADNLCAQCHTPTAPGSSPIMEAHLRPTESPAAPGLAFGIIETRVLPEPGTGGVLQITFEAWDKDGFLYTDLSEINNVAAAFAYPVPEFEAVVREAIVGFGGPVGALEANADGSFTYTFHESLPDLPGETFAVAMDGRLSFNYRGESHTEGTATNAYALFTADGAEPQPRRAIVEEESCNQCHSEIRFHGEMRVGVDYCLMCHNPNATDVNQRPDEALPPETINFKDLIHKIHRGEDLAGEFTVYGFGQTPHDFTEVRFPGRLEDCQMCHGDHTEQLPVSPDALSTRITFEGEIIRDVLPERAACNSCHDGLMPNIHAIAATEDGVETCATCHGPGRAASVHNVHRLGP